MSTSWVKICNNQREVWPREVCSITKKWKPELVIAQRLIWTKVVKQKFSQQPLFLKVWLLKVWIGYILIILNCKLQRYCGKIMALKGKESWSHDAHLHMWPPECFPYIKGRKVEARIWQESLIKCQIKFFVFKCNSQDSLYQIISIKPKLCFPASIAVLYRSHLGKTTL